MGIEIAYNVHDDLVWEVNNVIDDPHGINKLKGKVKLE